MRRALTALFLAALISAAGWAGLVAANRTTDQPLLAVPRPSELFQRLRQALAPSPKTTANQTKMHRSEPMLILMYHHVRAVDSSLQGTLDWNLSVSPDQFAEQLRLLRERGFQTVSLEDWRTGASSAVSRPICLTFDDAYVDLFDQAWPLLRQYGFTATVYAISDRLDDPGFLTRDQLAALAGAGWEIGSHTASHPNVTKLTGRSLTSELSGSRQTLQAITGQSVVTFSYPSGEYDEVAVDHVQQAGFRTAVTTDEGLADSTAPLALARRRIRPTMTAAEFGSLLDQSK